MATTIHPREHPRVILLMANPRVQVAVAVVSLCAIVVFGYSMFAFRPYDGMDFLVGAEADTVVVDIVYEGGPADDAGILAGDRILAIDDRPVDGWGNIPLYRPHIAPGDTVVYQLERDDIHLAVSAIMGSYRENLPLTLTFVGLLLLSVLFWGIGLAICLFAAPGDVRARLVGLLWLLGAAAVAAGGPGTYSKFWGAYTTMEVVWCLLGLVFVATHLYFPAPSFVARRRLVIGTLTVIALILSALVVLNEWLLNPQGRELPDLFGFRIYEFVYAFFLLSVLASIGLLLRNRLASQDAEVKRQIGIVFWGTALGFVPFLALNVMPHLLFNVSYGRYVTVLFLVFMPLAYAYAIHQRKLLSIDFFINRTVVLFVLILLVLIVSILILGTIASILDLPPEFFLIGGIVASLIAIPSANLRQPVQRCVNQVLYGCHYDFPTVTSGFSSQLARTLDRERLIELLAQNLAHQMGIHQTALFLSEGDSLTRCFPQPEDAESDSISRDDELYQLLLEHQMPVQAPQVQRLLSEVAQTRWQSYDWAQLFVPLVFESQLVGLLVLGDRTTGNLYGDDDVHLVATIAQQGALAYTSVQLVETLRGLNRRLVRKDEAHRKRVARELHDTALQGLFFIKERLLVDDRDDERLIGLLDETIGALRGMIREQRPPFIEQGLVFALQGMVEEMNRLTDTSPAISLSSNLSETTPLKLSDEQATALYRIAQEAATNAVKHADAHHVIISIATETGEDLVLRIEDDGVGMRSTPGSATGEYHYGLIGMQERAAMIGAQLDIASSPGEGTCVEVQICL
jgi:signal transduction histidine kinase